MNPVPPRAAPLGPPVQDIGPLSQDPVPSLTAAAVLRAVAADPDDEWAWARLTGWLAAHGHGDEAEAVRVFWPVIADSVHNGQPLAEVMGLVRRHAPAIARLAQRIGP